MISWPFWQPCCSSIVYLWKINSSCLLLTVWIHRSQHSRLQFCLVSLLKYESGKEFLYPIYTIQPVVKLVVQLVWQPAVWCKQTSNRLSNRLSNGFDNRLNVCIHTIQPVVKPVWQPVWQRVWQQVVSYKRTFTGPLLRPSVKVTPITLYPVMLTHYLNCQTWCSRELRWTTTLNI